MLARRVRLLLCCAIAVILVGGQMLADSKETGKEYLLQYRFQANQVVSSHVSHRSVMSVTKQNSRSTDKNDSETDKHFTVISVDGQGTAILEPVIDSVKITVQSGNNPKVTFDSQSKEKPHQMFRKMASTMAKTIGKPLVRLKISKHGVLLMALPLQATKNQTKLDQAKAVTHSANKNFLVTFPKKPIRVGATWSDRTFSARIQVQQGRRGLFQDYPILRTYQFDSVNGNIATISFRSASLKAMNDPLIEGQMAQRLPEGIIQFDLQRGMIISRILKTKGSIVGALGPQSRLDINNSHTEKMVPQRVVQKGNETPK